MHDNKPGNALQAHAAPYWAVFLALAAALFAGWIAFHYRQQPLLEANALRQTQTALTSLWMMKEGWQLAYQTPVGGYPWSVPFEFPIFQSMAALMAAWGDYPLTPAGRLLSFLFLLGCAGSAFAVARRLDLPETTPWVFCALLWSSPLYVFWGRSFMIETAALFFGLAAIPHALDLRAKQAAWRSACMFALMATLAMLQKVTTAAPIVLLMMVMLSVSHIQDAGLTMPGLRKAVCVLSACVIPVFVGAVWTHYTDTVKQQSTFGAALTSQALTQWNFGTVAQRFDAASWKTLLWDRAIANNACGLLGIFLIAGALYAGNDRIRKSILLSLALFLLPMVLFINLHIVHAYYQSACMVFLIAALALASTSWLPAAILRPGIAPILLLLALTNLLDLDVARMLFFDAVVAQNKQLILAISAVLVTAIALSNQRIRKIILLSVAGFVISILVSTNVHHAYNSSQYFSIVFLVSALTLLAAVFCCRKIAPSMMAPMLVWFLAIANLYHFSNDYAHKLWLPGKDMQPVTLTVGRIIDRSAPADSAVVVFGMDWSSEIAYYSERKSFTVPEWFKQRDDVWRNPAAFIGGKQLGAMVFSTSEHLSVVQILQQPDVKRFPHLLKFDKVYLWLPQGEAAMQAAGVGQGESLDYSSLK